MQITYTVYMKLAGAMDEGSDVTAFIDDIEVGNDRRQLYRSARLTFQGWIPSDATARWDIYATTDPAVPRSSLLLRNGLTAPDQQPDVTLDRSAVQNTQITVYDWAWFAQRIAPTSTVVAAPSSSKALKAVAAADQSAWPLGRWQYLPAQTMHDVVRGLAVLAGFSVELRIPNYAIDAVVFDPREQVWSSIWRLVEPFRPEAYFRRERNSVVIASGVDLRMGIGGTIELSDAAVIRAKIAAQRFRHLRQVIVRTPPWR
jgi:hypothetical protein